MIKIKKFLFKTFFSKDYDHMRHLVDDVIRLERENKELISDKTRGCRNCDLKQKNIRLESLKRRGLNE